MMAYADSVSEDTPLLLQALLMFILSESVFAGPAIRQEDDFKTKILARSRDYMEEHLSQKISIEQIASHLGVSYSWFRKIFKELTGESPIRYLQQMRIRKAKYLLSSSDASIKSIGLECGFAAPGYFCNSFRNETGLTPLEFREKCR